MQFIISSTQLLMHLFYIVTVHSVLCDLLKTDQIDLNLRLTETFGS